jgi:hypothetical protein
MVLMVAKKSARDELSDCRDFSHEESIVSLYRQDASEWPNEDCRIIQIVVKQSSTRKRA